MEKVLTNPREAIRRGNFDYKEFIHNKKILDQEILDSSPLRINLRKKVLKISSLINS